MKTISTKIFESQDVVDLHNKFFEDSLDELDKVKL